MRYRPSMASFLGSSLYRLSPAMVAGLMIYLAGHRFNVAMWIATAIMFAFALWLFAETITVHTISIDADDEGVRLSSRGRVMALRWRDISSAILRERPNPITRTDRLLILKSGDRQLPLNISTLRPEDEAALLDLARRKTHVIVHEDVPAA